MCRTDVTSPQTVTVAQKLILQLSRYTQVVPESMCAPFGVCQDGIGMAVGITRAHASLELGRLIRTGSVEMWMAHIPKTKNKRMVYSLTVKGIQEAKEIRSNLLKIGVDDIGRILNDNTGSGPEYYPFLEDAKKEIEAALRRIELIEQMKTGRRDWNVVSMHLANATGIILRGNL